MRPLKDGIRSLVKIDFYGNVHKIFRGTNAKERAAHEAKVLKVLEERGCPNVPRLLEYKEEECTIITTNCGSPTPYLSKQRASLLFQKIEQEYGVIHDDPEPRNVTYDEKEGGFCVIDFELATIIENFKEGQFEERKKSEEEKLYPVITWEARTQSGSKKDENDDALMIFRAGLEHSETMGQNGSCSLFSNDLLLGVSDGMGGGNAGDLASRLTLEIMTELVPQTMQAVAQGHVPDHKEQLKIAISFVHKALNNYARSNIKHQGMGATLTLVWFTPDQLYVAHVGDSRLYRHREGKTQQLTPDHSFVWQALQRGELSEYAYREHPRRSVLYESMGGGHSSVNPWVDSFSYQKGDRYLLCTDGLVDGLWEKVIHNIFIENSFSTKEAADAYMERAVDGDGRDDITFIALDIS